MIQRKICSNGVVLYNSPLLQSIGIPHAFSTRLGGISPKPFDSLNLGNPSGCAVRDPSERIRENYRLLFQAAGCVDREHAWLHQIHGGRVVTLRPGVPHDNDTKADALATADARRALSIRVADCVPVLLASDDGRYVAAVHAGWRGVIAGVARETLLEMKRSMGIEASGIIAAIGPSIGFDAFEVGTEVLDEFVRVFGENAPIRRCEDDKGRVDLRTAVHRQLLEAGVLFDRIDDTDRCTHRDADEFFSHRRDNGISGRMAAIIGPIA
jgi:YfiH family protein